MARERIVAADFRGLYDVGMPDLSYRPAGYCPHCGYAIDPGRCSECGNEVAAGQLDQSPYWVRRRRFVKRTCLVLIPLFLILTGLWAYHRTDWPALLPTRTLLVLQGDQTSRMTAELWRRFNAGTLSTAEATRMLANGVEVDDSLGIRNPYPAGCDVRINLTIINRLVNENGWVFNISNEQIYVDDQKIEPEHGFRAHSYSNSTTYIKTIPALAAGAHAVEYRATLTLFGPLFRVAGRVLPSITVAGKQEILVEDKPIEAYVKGMWTPELADEFGAAIRVSAYRYREVPPATVHIDTNRLPVPIAGWAWVRLKGQEQFQKTYECVIEAGADDKSWGFPLPDTPEYEKSTHFDIRIVPDAQVSLEGRLDKYFGGIIEWLDVPVEEDKYSHDWSHEDRKKPTRIIHAPSPSTTGE